MRPAEQHLTPQELEELLFAASEQEILTADGEAAQSAKHHLESCAACQQMARKYTNADGILETLRARGQLSRPSKTAARGVDCPPEDVWARVATGLINEGVAARYVAHAAGCDWCGGLLRGSMEDLAQDVSAEDQAAIAQLPSAGGAWQREMASKLAVQNPRAASEESATEVTAEAANESAQKKPDQFKARLRYVWWPRFAFAAVGVLVVAAAGWVVWQKTKLPRADRLLAQAYSEQRTIELRMTGAAYGPIRVERGSSILDFGAPFHSAVAIIQTELSEHPEDPGWLQAQAKAHLLQWRYQDAIAELDEALALKPNDSALLLDKATAFFEEGDKLDQKAAYGHAADILGQLLRNDPDNPVALFNRAVVYERLEAPNEAIEDLKHYLKIDPTGDWAQEAGTRLSRLQQLIKAHDEAVGEPLLNPAALNRRVGDPDALEKVNDRIEGYLDLAMRDWLPTAFSTADFETRSTYMSALRILADLLAERHRDKWLNDLLDSATNSSAFASGVVSLSRAVEASDEGIPATTSEDSKAAENFFVRAGSTPGLLRAVMEEIYALQRTQHGDLCLTKAAALHDPLRKASYLWIEAQLDIDQGACSIMVERFAKARFFLKRAGEEAGEGRYDVLRLRQIGIEASVETDEGNLAGAIDRDVMGLAEYWHESSSPPIRSQQFYTDLSLAAEKLKEWHLALAMAKEGARSVSVTGNRSDEALTHALVGRMGLRAGDLDLAARELHQANVLLSALPPSEPTRIYQMDAEIDMAGVELEEGKLSSVESQLKSVEASLSSVQSFTIPLRFHQTYASLYEKERRLSEAEEAFRKAILIANSGQETIADLDERYTWNQETSQLYREAVQLELTKGDTDRALALWEWYRSLSFRSATQSAKSFDLSALDASLIRPQRTFADHTVVSFAVLPKGLAEWVIDNHGIYGRFLELDSENLVSTTEDFTRMCHDRDSDLGHLNARSKWLYKLLIQPIAERLTSGRTVLIEADDLLSDVPFEALMTPSGEYWGSLYSLVFSPGLFYDQELRPPAQLGPNSKTLIVSSEVSATGDGDTLVPIKGQIDQESAGIAARFKYSRVLSGKDASIVKVEAELPAADVFHFAGHAVTNGLQEGLLLADDPSLVGAGRAIWGADHVRPALLKHLQLVVLAACSTGQTSRNRLETRKDLVRTMLAGGVPHVVASRWDVDSVATARFMDVFYSELTAGKPFSAAISRAELGLRERTETRHPYYWAAFAGFGRSN